MNRIFATLGTLALLSTLAACGGQDEKTPAQPSPSSSAPSESGSDAPQEPEQSSEATPRGDDSTATAEGTMKAYLKASIAKDAARLCSLFGTADGPVREQKETLQTCTDMYSSVLSVKQGEEGWDDVGTIVAESKQALADGPSDAQVGDDSATFTYDALTEGKPVSLVRHGKEWFIKVD